METWNAMELCVADNYTVRFGREPQAESLKRALDFLGAVMQTLVAKEAGYGKIDDHKVEVFAPDCTPEMRIRVRLDEKLTRISRLGVDTTDEDTLLDLVGYLALLAGMRTRDAHETSRG